MWFLLLLILNAPEGMPHAVTLDIVATEQQCKQQHEKVIAGLLEMPTGPNGELLQYTIHCLKF